MTSSVGVFNTSLLKIRRFAKGREWKGKLKCQTHQHPTSGALLWLSQDLASFLKEEPTGEREWLAVLDLRGKSRLRSEEPVERVEPQLPLSREASALQIYLPIGSEEGQYEVQLLRSPDEQPLVRASGAAELRNQNVILEVDFNVGEVTTGKYLLGIRKPGFSWAYYALNVAD